MVLGFFGGFVGSTFIGILLGSEFSPMRSSLSLEILKYLPPFPSSGVLVYRKKSIFLHWETEIFVRTQCTNSAKLFLVVLSTSMAALSTSLSFYFKFVFLRATKTVLTYIVQKTVHSFLSPYPCIPPWVRAKHGPRVH